MKFILEAFADRVADEIKPSDIDAWISSHKWSAATKNRYKNVFGKTFKIALADGKVTSNPARMVEQRAENNARIRFLSADEEKRLRARSPYERTPTQHGVGFRALSDKADPLLQRVNHNSIGVQDFFHQD
jgi:site-specific recombinase XerD